MAMEPVESVGAAATRRPRSWRELVHAGILRLPVEAPGQALLRRVLFAIGVILMVAGVQWVFRDGLRDAANPDRPLDFADVLYFTVVSLMTVGYGDIAPATTGARLFNVLVLSPVRIILLILFIGTAYELALLRLGLLEGYRMRHLTERLVGHVIICGYGVKGRTIAAELMAHGHRTDQIVVIDADETAVAAASEAGHLAFRGDASAEAMLRAARIERAAYVLAAPDRDDACVLICLTVRSLAANVHLVAAAREEENVKLLYRAGADLVIAPSVSGGRLMAAAVRQQAVPRFLEDLLSFGQGLDMAEHVVQPDEAGRLVSELPDLRDALVMGVLRDQERCPYSRLADWPLAAGDIIVYLRSNPTA
jgi:voltage-gated potassium channel